MQSLGCLSFDGGERISKGCEVECDIAYTWWQAHTLPGAGFSLLIVWCCKTQDTKRCIGTVPRIAGCCCKESPTNQTGGGLTEAS